MPELIRIGLQWKHEHETMVSEIVAELKEARCVAALSLADMQATTGMDRAELSRLLDVCRKAKHFADDQRLGVNGRQSRVAELFDDLAGLCVARSGSEAEQKAASSDETDCEFDNLVQEITRLMCDSELFTFVLHPEADGTNNEAERSLRGAAQDRRTGREARWTVSRSGFAGSDESDPVLGSNRLSVGHAAA